MNIEIKTLDEDLVIKFKNYIYALSSTVDGGFRKIRYIVFSHVKRHEDIELKVKTYKNRLGQESMIFLTAVKPAVTNSITIIDEVLVVETAGFENIFTIRRGDVISRLEKTPSSTINISVYIDRELAPPDLVELIQTVTYAKSASLIEHEVKLEDNYALGTTSDAVLVACRDLSADRHYTGPVTHIGRKVISAVYKSTSNLLHRLRKHH